jgi:hypothetical protein
MPTAKRPMVRIHDTSTDEVIDREMNDAEFAEHQNDVAAIEAKNAAVAVERNAKISAYEKLGLTAEEITALLG